MNKLELVGAAALFVGAKFHEINPPKLGRMTELAASEAERILSFEKELLECLDFRVVAPTDLAYIELVFLEVNSSQALRADLLKYLKIGLFLNFLRKHNPREVVLCLVKRIVEQNYPRALGALRRLATKLEVEESRLSQVFQDFNSDYKSARAFSKSRGIEGLLESIN